MGRLPVMTPSSGFLGRQFGLGQRLGQVAAQADLLQLRPQAGEGQAVLEQDKRDVLIMGAVDAIGKIARRLRDTDGRLSHKIRLSDCKGVSICGDPLCRK